MEISIVQQNGVFFYAFVIGAFLGAFYDVFRIQRIFMGTLDPNVPPLTKKKIPLSFLKHMIVFVEDILFFVVAAVIITIFIFHANSGQIRWFALFGTGIGFFVYRNTMGRLVMLCSEWIVSILRKILSFLYQRLIQPPLRAIGIAFRKMQTAFSKKVRIRYSNTVCTALIKQAKLGFKKER